MIKTNDGRLFAGLFLTIVALYAWPLLLPAAPPDWWQVNRALKVNEGVLAPPVDYAAINQGQLKNIAVSAYEHLLSVLPPQLGTVGTNPDGTPSTAGQAILALVSSWVELDPGSGRVLRQVMESGTPAQPLEFTIEGTGARKRVAGAAAHHDFRGVTQGQLKAVAKPFYRRLAELYAPYGYPFAWTDDDDTDTSEDTEDDQNSALANAGQLKQVFSFNLLGDADGDRVPDVVELSRMRDGVREPTDPRQSGDLDGDGMADDWERAWNLDPTSIDSSSLVVGSGAVAGTMYQAGVLPTTEGPPASEDWTPTPRVALRQTQLYENEQDYDVLTWDVPPTATGSVTIEREIEDDVWVPVHNAPVQSGQAQIPTFDRNTPGYLENVWKGIVPNYGEAFNHRLRGAVTSNESVVQVRLRICRVFTDVTQPGFAEFSSTPQKYYLSFDEVYTSAEMTGSASATLNVTGRTFSTDVTQTIFEMGAWEGEATDTASAVLTFPAPANLEESPNGAFAVETISGGGHANWKVWSAAEKWKSEETSNASHTRKWERTDNGFEVSFSGPDYTDAEGTIAWDKWVFEEDAWQHAETIDYWLTDENSLGAKRDSAERPDWEHIVQPWVATDICLFPSWQATNFQSLGTASGSGTNRTHTYVSTNGNTTTHTVTLSQEFTPADLQAWAISMLPDFTIADEAGSESRLRDGHYLGVDRLEPDFLSRQTLFSAGTVLETISERRLVQNTATVTRSAYRLECNDCLISDPVVLGEVEISAATPSTENLIRTLAITPGARPGKAQMTEMVISDVTAATFDVSRRLKNITIEPILLDAAGNLQSSDTPRISRDYPVINLSNVQVSNIRLDANGKLCGDVTVTGEVKSNLCDMMAGPDGQIDSLKLFVNEMTSPAGFIPVNVTKGSNGTIGKPFPFIGHINHTLVGIPLTGGANVLRVEGQDRIFRQPGFSEWRVVVRSLEVPVNPPVPNPADLLENYGFTVVLNAQGQSTNLVLIRGGSPPINIELSSQPPALPGDPVVYVGSIADGSVRLHGFEGHLAGERRSLSLDVLGVDGSTRVTVVLTESGIGAGSFGGNAIAPTATAAAAAAAATANDEETLAYYYLEKIHLVHHADDPRFCSFVYKVNGLPPGGNEVTIKLVKTAGSGSLAEIDLRVRELLVQSNKGYFVADPNATRPMTFILRPPITSGRSGVGVEFEPVPTWVNALPTDVAQASAGVFAGMGHGGVDLVMNTGKAIQSGLSYGMTTADGYRSLIMLNLPWTDRRYWETRVETIGQELEGINNKAIQNLAEACIQVEESGLREYIIGFITGDVAQREEGATRLSETLGPLGSVLEDAMHDTASQHPFIRGKVTGRIGLELLQVIAGGKGAPLKLQEIIARLEGNPFMQKRLPKMRVLAAEIKGSPLKDFQRLAHTQLELEKAKFGITAQAKNNALRERAVTYEDTIKEIKKKEGPKSKAQNDFDLNKGAHDIIVEQLKDYAKGAGRTVQLSDLKGYTYWDDLFKKHGIARRGNGGGWDVHHLAEKRLQEALDIDPVDNNCPSILLPRQNNIDPKLGNPGTAFHATLAGEIKSLIAANRNDKPAMLLAIKNLYDGKYGHLHMWPATRDWLIAKLPPGSYVP